MSTRTFITSLSFGIKQNSSGRRVKRLSKKTSAQLQNAHALEKARCG